MKKARLDEIVFKRGYATSKTQAAALIMAGSVFVEGKLHTKPGHSLPADVEIHLKEAQRYVSRAALKLESVVQKLSLHFKDKVVLDIGSSTGGFTDYALQHGAKKVYAIDVGTNQLDSRLRGNEKIDLREKTDIRDVHELPDKIDIALADVSFISLRKILPGIRQLLKPNAMIVAMVKPQFEADRQTASMHKGVIKNNRIRREILRQFEDWTKSDFIIDAKADSAVAGAKGNVERFYLLRVVKKL